jgi:hypothetical protein
VLVLQIAPNYPRNPLLLSDIRSTYASLSSNDEDILPYLRTFDGDCLWLNVDDGACEEWEWCSATEIVFNSRNDGQRKQAKREILGLKQILVNLGARDVKPVAAPVIQPPPAETELSVLREAFQRMRNTGVLTDVVFVSQEEDEFAAHRTLLAALSSHFEQEFSGAFLEAGPASAAQPIRIVVDDFSSQAIQAVIGESRHLFE